MVWRQYWNKALATLPTSIQYCNISNPARESSGPAHPHTWQLSSPPVEFSAYAACMSPGKRRSPGLLSTRTYVSSNRQAEIIPRGLWWLRQLIELISGFRDDLSFLISAATVVALTLHGLAHTRHCRAFRRPREGVYKATQTKWTELKWTELPVRSLWNGISVEFSSFSSLCTCLKLL